MSRSLSAASPLVRRLARPRTVVVPGIVLSAVLGVAAWLVLNPPATRQGPHPDPVLLPLPHAAAVTVDASPTWFPPLRRVA